MTTTAHAAIAWGLLFDHELSRLIAQRGPLFDDMFFNSHEDL
jgi:hypothetical protein